MVNKYILFQLNLILITSIQTLTFEEEGKRNLEFVAGWLLLVVSSYNFKIFFFCFCLFYAITCKIIMQ
jgi:hypothetical protein